MDTGAESIVTMQPANQQAEGGLIPTSALHFRIIPWYVAKAFITEHHYLKGCPAQHKFGIGVFSSSEPFAPIIGALLWGMPNAANRLRDGWVTFELTRMVILDCTTMNAESRALGWSARYIKKHYPEIKHLLAYSDVGGRGHTGTIYKAAGWNMDARTLAANTDWNKHSGAESHKGRGSGTEKLRWRKTL